MTDVQYVVALKEKRDELVNDSTMYGVMYTTLLTQRIDYQMNRLEIVPVCFDKYIPRISTAVAYKVEESLWDTSLLLMVTFWGSNYPSCPKYTVSVKQADNRISLYFWADNKYNTVSKSAIRIVRKEITAWLNGDYQLLCTLYELGK